MDHAAIARLNFNRLDPLVFVEIGLDHDILIGDDACRFYGYRLGELKHRIRLADQPAVVERGGSWSVALVAGVLAAVDPGHQVALFGDSELAFVGPLVRLFAFGDASAAANHEAASSLARRPA